MSVAGILGSSIFQSLTGASSLQSGSASAQTNYQNFQQEFQQLGQALSSGNLSAAQADFAAMQPQGASSAQSTSSPVATAMKQLATDLQSGNLTAAQQDYSTVKQDLQSSGGGHSHHHHHHAGSSPQDFSQNPINQLFGQLGQALQSGNVSAAQSVYSSMQQDFQLLGAGSSGTSGAVSLTA
jgi:outer membrane protein assembly factor BamD (BamD/ComL family)